MVHATTVPGGTVAGTIASKEEAVREHGREREGHGHARRKRQVIEWNSGGDDSSLVSQGQEEGPEALPKQWRGLAEAADQGPGSSTLLVAWRMQLSWVGGDTILGMVSPSLSPLSLPLLIFSFLSPPFISSLFLSPGWSVSGPQMLDYMWASLFLSGIYFSS